MKLSGSIKNELIILDPTLKYVYDEKLNAEKKDL